MKTREIRHTRIVELRNMALRGATLSQLVAKCTSWGLSASTTKSYTVQVGKDIQKIIDRREAK